MVKNNSYLNTDENIEFNNKLEISSEKFVSQIKIDEAMAVVNSLKFEQMDNKLIKSYGWSKEDISSVNKSYKKWLVLAACYPELPLVPTMKLDEYWHMHILDTKKYMEDCQLIFGKYMHHYPYFGIEGDSDYADKCFILTKELFKKHFGDNVSNQLSGCGIYGCKNNCCSAY